MSRLYMQITKSPEGDIEFQGRVPAQALLQLTLDPSDRAVLDYPSESAIDWLQDLEIIYRRHAEQFPAAPVDVNGAGR